MTEVQLVLGVPFDAPTGGASEMVAPERANKRLYKQPNGLVISFDQGAKALIGS